MPGCADGARCPPSLELLVLVDPLEWFASEEGLGARRLDVQTGVGVKRGVRVGDARRDEVDVETCVGGRAGVRRLHVRPGSTGRLIDSAHGATTTKRRID